MTPEQFNAINDNLKSLVLLGCLSFGLFVGIFWMSIQAYRLLTEMEYGRKNKK